MNKKKLYLVNNSALEKPLVVTRDDEKGQEKIATIKRSNFLIALVQMITLTEALTDEEKEALTDMIVEFSGGLSE